MLLWRPPFLVARLCSVSRVVSAGLSDISGLAVGVVDLINCSWSVFWLNCLLALVSKRCKVKMGLCATIIIKIILITRITIIANNIFDLKFHFVQACYDFTILM